MTSGVTINEWAKLRIPLVYARGIALQVGRFWGFTWNLHAGSEKVALNNFVLVKREEILASRAMGIEFVSVARGITR